MSVRVMGMVWDLGIQSSLKFVLLAYADHADHAGGNIYPAIATIAKKVGCSERTAQRATRQLEAAGLLIPEGGQVGGTGITAHWRIPIKGDRIAPFAKGDIHDMQRVTSTTQRVTNRALKGDTAMSPEPSLTIIKPSNKTERGGAIFTAFENNIAMLTPGLSDKITGWIDDFPEDWILEAIQIAVERNARNAAYIQAILDRWQTDGKDSGKPSKNGRGKPADVDRSSPEARKKYAEWGA